MTHTQVSARNYTPTVSGVLDHLGLKLCCKTVSTASDLHFYRIDISICFFFIFLLGSEAAGNFNVDNIWQHNICTYCIPSSQKHPPRGISLLVICSPTHSIITTQLMLDWTMKGIFTWSPKCLQLPHAYSSVESLSVK